MPCKLAISSMSLGRCFAGHDLFHKLDMAQKHGYRGIELFDEDLIDIASKMEGHDVGSPPPKQPSSDALIAAARQIHRMCVNRDLHIVCLQPFRHYEGLVDRDEHERRLSELSFWIKIAHALHTDLIAVPSTFLPAKEVSEDKDLSISDLRKAADMAAAASPVIRLSFESLAWGTRSDTWEKSWELVQSVDRANFGMCLDTFNIAARIYADPASATGMTPDAVLATKQSMERLVERVDPQRVFLVQVVDAEMLEEPLVKGHEFYDADQPARMSWSRNCRLFYRERELGAYLPVKDIALAIFKGLGWEGWVSLELFNRRMEDRDAEVPEELAQRGASSWRKLVKDMGIVGMDTDPRDDDNGLGEEVASGTAGG